MKKITAYEYSQIGNDAVYSEYQKLGVGSVHVFHAHLGDDGRLVVGSVGATAVWEKPLPGGGEEFYLLTRDEHGEMQQKHTGSNGRLFV